MAYRYITHADGSRSRVKVAAAPTTALDAYRKRIGLLAGQGETARADLADRYQALQGAGIQDLISRGMMGGGIVASSMKRGVERDYQRQLMALNESVNRQQAGALGDYGSALERLREFNARQSMDMSRLNLAQRAQSRYRMPRSSGFTSVQSQSVLPGSYQSLLGNRAYQRANRLYG